MVIWLYEAHRLTAIAIQNYFKDDTFALIGYGSQGHGQGLNLRDNGLNVIVGVRKNGKSWNDAIQDGWVPGKNLFEVDDAISRGTIVMNLLSDAAQSETWPSIKPQLTEGKVCGCAAPPPHPHGSLIPLRWRAIVKVATNSAVCHRLCTSLTASPPSSRTSPRLMSPRTLTSSFALPRALAELSAPSSVRAVVSTPHSPSTRM